ncbi:MAG: EamA family transporter [Gammaproteobacteria bacterium]|nr:EamA family transporter [Gammaproteobacteria bacterium]
MPDLSRHLKGVMISALGVLIISPFGDIAAMAGAFFLAAGFTVVRVKPTISVFPIISTSGLMTALVILPLTQQGKGFLIIVGVYMLLLGTGLMYIGPKYIPVSEVGLMLLLESVLEPTWIWLALDEKPGLSTFIGGAIILGTLASNTLWAMKSATIARRMRSLPGLYCPEY